MWRKREGVELELVDELLHSWVAYLDLISTSLLAISASLSIYLFLLVFLIRTPCLALPSSIEIVDVSFGKVLSFNSCLRMPARTGWEGHSFLKY